ncbi:unnamed protein product, partial [Discosporangium mesarthrocarpum]
HFTTPPPPPLDTPAHRDTALHFASRWGRTEAVNTLFQAGARQYIRNAESRTPLDVAAEGLASEGEMDRLARETVRRAFFGAEPKNRTLVLHHPGEFLY